MKGTFYWYDYETWGADPARDRPAQFAGQRTDARLNPVAEPLVLYCRPSDDLLPQPEACLITGLTPREALQKGVPEREFIDRIHAELAAPGTCGAGYNSLHFDDEVTRYTLYRNFFDPYAREWRNGNSRWDLIDVMRLAHALRPAGIEWPTREDGLTSFRLEHLSAANGIGHASAHDALSDVHATIGLARRLRERQPRLFDYALTLRDKRTAASLLDLAHPRPVLHVSSRFPAELGCIAPVLPLAAHPVNRNEVIVLDLRADPRTLLDLDAEGIRRRVFTRAEDLPDGAGRIPLKTVRLNRSPMLAPLATLTPEAAERWRIDPDQVQRHAEILGGDPGLSARLQAVFRREEGLPARDPELDLYGGFLDDADRLLCDRVRARSPRELAGASFPFRDPRLPVLLFRYRARNWPETLTADERRDWDVYRRHRLNAPDGGGSIQLPAFREEVARLRQERSGDPTARSVLDDLDAWAAQIGGG